MRDYIKELGIRTYINAHDTITLYGASRVADNTREAMNQISRCFVDVTQVQQAAGDRIAELTHNEAAYIANCASGALQLCAAVCMARGDAFRYRALPQTHGGPDEIVVLHSQHNCYDKSVEAAGAKIVLVGDADETLAFDLEGSLSEKTAAVLYCPASIYRRGALPVEEVVRIAHAKGVPVIVDAAAQLPPVENLWGYTQKGCDMVVFSGGKTLCGPQTSGLIVGKAQFIEDCRRFGAPMHGICRSSKAAKEDMIGLCVAIENYMALDQAKARERLSGMVDRMVAAMQKNAWLEPYRQETGSVGQDYPRAFAKVKPPHSVERMIEWMRDHGVFIGMDAMQEAIYMSPLNLTDEECDTVCALLERAGLPECCGDRHGG